MKRVISKALLVIGMLFSASAAMAQGVIFGGGYYYPAPVYAPIYAPVYPVIVPRPVIVAPAPIIVGPVYARPGIIRPLVPVVRPGFYYGPRVGYYYPY